MFSKPPSEGLPPSTLTPAREDHMLPDIKDKSNQFLVKKIQLCPIGCSTKTGR